MMIFGVDLNKLAEPATFEMIEGETSIIFRLSYCGRTYQRALSCFELLRMNSNDVIVNHITNIINEGKYVLGATSD